MVEFKNSPHLHWINSFLECLNIFLPIFKGYMKPSNRFSAYAGVFTLLIGALLISLCLPGSQGAGQFLLEKPTFFSRLDANSLLGIVLLGLINVSLLRWILKKTGVAMNPLRTLLAYGVSVVMGVLIVLAIHRTALTVVSLPMPTFIDQHSTSNAGNTSSDLKSSMQNYGLRLASKEACKSSELVSWASIFVGLLFLIGGGYACMSSQSPLLSQFIVSTLGVGIAEESAKLLVAFFAFRFFRPKFHGSGRMAVIYFSGLAGLAFGTGEAFYYFHQYQQSGVGFFPYLARVAWCVPLHMVWAIISATLFFKKFLTGTDTTKWTPAKTATAFLLTIAPSAFLHGIYDSFAFRGMRAMWFFGSVSFFIAYAVVFLQKEGQRNIFRQIAIVVIMGSVVFSVPHLLDYAHHKTVIETCSVCNGAGRVDCPKYGIGETVGLQLSRSTLEQMPPFLRYLQHINSKNKCSTCNGIGYLSCGQCKGSGQISRFVTLFGE